MNSDTAYIIATVWLVGSVCLPLGSPWWARTAMIAFAVYWHVQSYRLRIKKEKERT
jgi:uncharacterized protein involved in response to NO